MQVPEDAAAAQELGRSPLTGEVARPRALTIRLADPRDAVPLADVAAVTFPLACPPSTPEAAVRDFVTTHLSAVRFADHLADPARVLLVADAGDGAPLRGYTMLVLGETSDPDVARALRIRPTSELSKCYVRADEHGSGIAAALLSRTLDEARRRGAAGTWLGTNVANARAIRFYEKHGFVKVGSRRFRLGGEYEHDHVLEIAL